MSTSSRRSSRLHPQDEEIMNDKKDDGQVESESEDDNENNADDEEQEQRHYEFEGNIYHSYQEMVNAKRKRNEEYLKENGLWNPSQKFRDEARQQKEASKNGIKRRKIAATARKPTTRRSSNRLAGTPASGKFIEHEGGGTVIVAESTSKDGIKTLTNSKTQMTTTSVVNNPYNRERATADGASLTMDEAILLCEPKWVQEASVKDAKAFHTEVLLAVSSQQDSPIKKSNGKNIKSPTTVVSGTKEIDTLPSLIEGLSLDDDDLVAKVTPDKIYSIATHPSKQHLIIAAGDKNGYLGLWNVNTTSSATKNPDSSSSSSKGTNDGVHLFRPHTRPINTLHWLQGGAGLLSSSYDGTVRHFDVQNERFDEVFATNEDTDNFYTQHLEIDHRSTTQDAFFLSTSAGTVFHLDRRMGGGGGTSKSRSSNGAGIVFHAQLSEKKINSVSLHRDGYCLATGGLDRTVKFWDLRKFGGTKVGTKGTSSLDPTVPKGALLGEHFNKLSVNSAIFSPSGDYLVTTNQADTLNIYHQAHLSTGKKNGSSIVQPEHVIRHNNQTGRWLTTFMTSWHPELDIFCVGSLAKPRAMDIFDGATGEHLRAVRGEALTAVASRCCFHVSTDKIILVGGNSSGRVTVAM